jgi:hypothetical protein
VIYQTKGSKMAIKIEKGLRIPDEKLWRHNRQYPFAEMKIGDSFAVPLVEEAKVRSATSHYAARNGVRFRVIKMKDNLRVWKVKSND